MTRRRTLVLVFGGAIALILAFVFLRRPSATYHTRSWQRSMRLAIGGPIPWWDRIYGAMNSKQPQHWWDVASHHENELLKMGYITNCQFRLTNQVMTRELSSNFISLIHQRLGTNTDQIWRCPTLTNGAGIDPMFRVKDYAVWEQTFRECATRYASNLPPQSVTSVPTSGGR